MQGPSRETPPDAAADRLTDYERAVCYYALPKVVHPVTFGLLVAYAVCVLETIGLMAYGAMSGRERLLHWGVGLFAGMVVFGIVIFVARAVMNDVRERRLLRSAHRAPQSAALGAGDLPDPFAGHVLWCYAPGAKEVTDNAGRPVFMVERERLGRVFKLTRPTDTQIVEIDVRRWGRSFFYEEETPHRVVVRRGDREMARIRKRFSFTASKAEIRDMEGENRVIWAIDGGLYKHDTLIGRVYHVRRRAYLDVEESALTDGILGYFIAMA